MVIKNKTELQFLVLFIKWQTNSPEDRHKIQSTFINKRNTQTTRLAFILNLMALIKTRDFNITFQQLAKYTFRTKDKNSYLSKDTSWMKEPHHIKGDWYFEGCTSLKQKQACIQNITKIQFPDSFQFSPGLSDCSEDFIANKNLDKYKPTERDEEAYELYNEILEKLNSVGIDMDTFINAVLT